MKKKLLTIMAILGVFVSSTSFAYASIFDWLNQDQDSAIGSAVDTTNWSFDKLYATIQGFTLAKNMPTVQGGSITTTNSPLSPKSNPKKSVKTYLVLATGYSSTKDQTDDTPFITASGTYTRDGVVAANFLPIGTIVKIPELFGDKIFIVEDRMNSRYWYNIDIWFPERGLAKTFGVKRVRIEIVS